MSDSVAEREFHYRAFISYSHADKAWASWLHKALETWRAPARLVGAATPAGPVPRRLTPIFRDREELASATDLGRTVNDALARSACLIVICSPHSASSHWVDEEVRAFKRMRRGERIFCLIVAGEPNASDLPGRADEECFCPALRMRYDDHGQPTGEHAEPIAADARPAMDGKTNAKLKLIAGMLGLNFDALKQREVQRRAHRLLAITALALLVMLATSALAVYALIARHNTEVARQAAVRRQGQAESLVDFMLGDLSTKLRQVDRLDILDAVDHKAMAYFESLPVSDVNPTTLTQRAKALRKIGSVRMNQGHLSQALTAFQQALEINRHLVAQTPRDAARQNAYGENLLWIGVTYWSQGHLDRAEALFQQATGALHQAAVLAPSDNGIHHNLDNAYNNLGHVAQARAELDRALQYYRSDLALCQTMARAKPDDVEWQNALGVAYANLGNIALARGHVDQALTGYSKNQMQVALVVKRHPRDRRMQEQLVVGDAMVGRTLAQAGQAQTGLAYIRAALAIGEQLHAFDPSHTGWEDNYAFYHALLGQLLLDDGQLEAAAAPIQAATASLRKLVSSEAKDTKWRSNLAEAQLQGARLALARKHLDAAQKQAASAAETMATLTSRKTPKVTWQRLAARIALLRGEIAQANGAAAAAAQYRQQALAQLRPLAGHSLDPRDLSLLAQALLATGDRSQAQTVIDQLAKTGYQPADFVARLRANGIHYRIDADVARRIKQAVQGVARP